MQPCKGSSLLKADTGPQQVQQTVRQQLMKSSTTLFFIKTSKDQRLSRFILKFRFLSCLTTFLDQECKY